MIARENFQAKLLAELEHFQWQNPEARRFAIYLCNQGSIGDASLIPSELFDEICQAYEDAIVAIGPVEMNPFVYGIFCDLWGAWAPEDFPWFDESYDPDAA